MISTFPTLKLDLPEKLEHFDKKLQWKKKCKILRARWRQF